ncbi:MAG: type I methionyl aminopeptidase [Gemmatimonadetes bacterium]|nr:type I methionyl aminopeptidase [Gemmatimonadota bacterium]MBT6147857.1 type I methionyl aminopeptidase [Gemmatimonadota bacterium]
MMHLKSSHEIEKIRASCRIAADAMACVARMIAPGVTTAALDEAADVYIRSQGAVASALNYRGYPRSICASINEEVVHGIPGSRQLVAGDIVSIDIAVKNAGYHGDMNVSFAVGDIAAEAARLLDTTKGALEIGLQCSEAGTRLGDIGHRIQTHVEEAGFSVVRDYCGHGIGRNFHEEPQLLHFGTPGTGRRLQPGVVFTVEPMVNEGTADVRVLDDDWTAVTTDGALSAQFEHTVAVSENGPDILSRFDDLPF